MLDEQVRKLHSLDLKENMEFKLPVVLMAHVAWRQMPILMLLGFSANFITNTRKTGELGWSPLTVLDLHMNIYRHVIFPAVWIMNLQSRQTVDSVAKYIFSLDTQIPTFFPLPLYKWRIWCIVCRVVHVSQMLQFIFAR